MVIKDVLDHPWLQRFNKNKIAEQRRNSKDSKVSAFKLYATINEQDVNITEETKIETNK